MQDRTYSDLLFLIQSLVGGGNLTTEEQGSIDSFINRRAHEAFQTSQTWPRFLVGSEERNVSSFITSGISDGPSIYNRPYYKYGIYTHTGTSTSNFYVPVNQDDATNKALFFYKNAALKWVWGTGAYNQIVSGKDAINIASVTGIWIQLDSEEYDDPSQVLGWGSVSGAVAGTPSLTNLNLISYAETVETSDSSQSRVAKDTIGEFLKVYRKKAFLNDSSLEYDFFVDSNGANILNIANTTDSAAFVTYKKQLPQYTITSIDIPGEWFFFMAHGAYADFLRMEGKVEQSMAEEDVAQKYLAQELEKVDNMSNNNVFRRFSTHGTRQSR